MEDDSTTAFSDTPDDLDPDAVLQRAQAFADQLHMETQQNHAARVAGVITDAERRAAVWQLLTPHLASGASTWSEVFDRLTEEEWVELSRLVGQGDLAALLAPVPPPGAGRRHRWAGTAHKPLPLVTVQDASPESNDEEGVHVRVHLSGGDDEGCHSPSGTDDLFSLG